MKIIKISEERLKDILRTFKRNENLSDKYRNTYQIQEKPDIYLRIVKEDEG